jgi:hypothetical protein
VSVFYGSDTACVSDVGLTDEQVTSPARLIGERLARLLQTPRGGLGVIGDDPDRGWDCKQYVLARITPQLIALGRQQITNECMKDEEVQSVDVQFISTSSGSLQSIIVRGIASTGPFTLVGNVNTLTSSLFFEPAS